MSCDLRISLLTCQNKGSPDAIFNHLQQEKSQHGFFIFDRIFFYKFVIKYRKKRFFLVIFSKNFNWQVISSGIIIFYKIINFTSISYKTFFLKNVLSKIFYKIINSNFFEIIFHNIIYKYFQRKTFKTNIRIFNSVKRKQGDFMKGLL